MKKNLTIELDFESWFDENREPRTDDEWAEFFSRFLITESQVIGVEDDEFQDMVAIRSFSVEVVD